MTEWDEKKKPRKNKVRRDAKYQHINIVPVVRSLVGIGFTETEVALVLGVAPATLASWKSRYPNIFEANKEGKQIMKALLCSQMFRCATGYEYDEKDEEYLEDEDGNIVLSPEGKKIKKIKVHHKVQPGNPDLQKFMANNLMGDIFPRSPIQVSENIIALIGSVEPNRIRDFAGRLMELSSGTKQIDSIVRDNEQPEQPNSTTGNQGESGV
jgi:hypothetical protein